MTKLAQVKYALIGLGVVMLALRAVYVYANETIGFFKPLSIIKKHQTMSSQIKSNPVTVPSNLTQENLSPPSHVSDNLTTATENGQISAISSGRVSYHKKTYTVQEGDTLAEIALKVYGDMEAWQKIATANKLNSPDAIEVGDVLTLPQK